MGSFDNLSHELLLRELSEHIHDGRFIQLMRELLDAGYMEDWTFNRTLSGVPQGGIVSPLLSNILLTQLDRFVVTVLIPQYTRGARREINHVYQRLMVSSRHYRQRGNRGKAKGLRKQAQRLPTQDANDPNYRRLKYVRYADDFLLGFSGPRSEAEEIKQRLTTFLQEELKLELSQTKTLITHARTEAARFLGYEVTNRQVDEKRTVRRTSDRIRSKCRTVNGHIGLQVPKDVIEEHCRGYRRGLKAIHRAELMNESDFSITTRYQSEYRGVVNYYRLAYNLHTLSKLKWVMETSLTKTLAAKFKRSVPQIYEKYDAELEVQGKKYKVLQVVIPRQEKKPLVATWGGVPLAWDIQATLEEQPKKKWNSRSELEQRLLADFCELCGSTQKVEVHHVRKLSNLHRYPGRPKPLWALRMIALRRKTLLLCRTCHEDVDLGRPLRRQLIELAEVKALRKRAKARILESRML